MNISLVTPNLPEARSGNWVTAVRYRRILEGLGHRVRMSTGYNGEPADALIALHARRSHPSVRDFAAAQPGKPSVVVLTGTDLYRDIRTDADAQSSLDLASRLVVLQRMGLPELPERHRAKTRVIYQSVTGCNGGGAHSSSARFRVAVVGHLRAEKDPFRTALAARLLPADSRVQVLHAGSALDSSFAQAARAEEEVNPRYRWLEGIPHWRA